MNHLDEADEDDGLYDVSTAEAIPLLQRDLEYGKIAEVVQPAIYSDMQLQGRLSLIKHCCLILINYKTDKDSIINNISSFKRVRPMSIGLNIL